jgi:transaldolase
MAVRKISVGEALRSITAADVRDACDLLVPVAQRTTRDGRVSLEVAPGVAHDTDATAVEAAYLWGSRSAGRVKHCAIDAQLFLGDFVAQALDQWAR